MQFYFGWLILWFSSYQMPMTSISSPCSSIVSSFCTSTTSCAWNRSGRRRSRSSCRIRRAVCDFCEFNHRNIRRCRITLKQNRIIKRPNVNVRTCRDHIYDDRPPLSACWPFQPSLDLNSSGANPRCCCPGCCCCYWRCFWCCLYYASFQAAAAVDSVAWGMCLSWTIDWDCYCWRLCYSLVAEPHNPWSKSTFTACSLYSRVSAHSPCWTWNHQWADGVEFWWWLFWAAQCRRTDR